MDGNPYNSDQSMTIALDRRAGIRRLRLLRRAARRLGLNQPFGYWKRRKVAGGMIGLIHLPAILATCNTMPVNAAAIALSAFLWLHLMARTHTLRGWTVRLPAESIADLLRITLPLAPALYVLVRLLGEPGWPIVLTEAMTFFGLTNQALFWRGRPRSWVRILGSPSGLNASVNTFGQCMDLLGRDGCRFAPFRADKPEPDAWARRIEAWLERGETVLVLEPQLREVAQRIQPRGDVIFADDCILFTEIRRPAGRRMNMILGAFNKLLALGIVLLLWPIGLLIALLIKLDDGGPVFFAQERIGRLGKRFTIYKYRTMRLDTPAYHVHPDEGDERITRVGRWLRKLSLDELPQLINVARGEMRIVGPRPEMPFIVKRYGPAERQRLRVKPGITGLWQVSPHRNDPIHEHLEYDLAYIAHRGPILDLALVIATAGLAKSTGR